MGDRASAQPKHTTDSFLGGGEVPDDVEDDVEDDEEDSEGGDPNNIHKRNDEDSDDDDDDEAREEEKEEMYSRVSEESSLTSLTPTAPPPIDHTPVVHVTPVRKRPVIVSNSQASSGGISSNSSQEQPVRRIHEVEYY